MPAEQNEATVRSVYASMDKDRNMNILDKVAASAYRVHTPGMPSIDREGMKQFAAAFFAAMPDLKHEIQDIFAAGDRVALRLRIHGKHTQPLMGPAGAIPAQGKDVDFEAMNIWRFQNDKAAEHWVSFDMLTVLQQIGAMPAHQ